MAARVRKAVFPAAGLGTRAWRGGPELWPDVVVTGEQRPLAAGTGDHGAIADVGGRNREQKRIDGRGVVHFIFQYISTGERLPSSGLRCAARSAMRRS